MLERCYRCDRMATGSINTSFSAASSVPSVMRPVCDEHQMYRCTIQERWVVVPQDNAQFPWAVRDQEQQLGDLWQKHHGHAMRIARDRNRRMPWLAAPPADPAGGDGADRPPQTDHRGESESGGKE